MSATSTNPAQANFGTRAIGFAADKMAALATRRALARLDEDTLHDIGLTQSDLRGRNFHRVWKSHSS